MSAKILKKKGYSDTFKLDVLLDYYGTLNVVGTARDHDIAVTTLQIWIRELEGANPDGDVQLALYELQKKVEAVETIKLAASLRKKIQAKLAGDATIKDSLQQLSMSFGIMQDKARQLMSADAKSSTPIAIQINFGVPRPK